MRRASLAVFAIALLSDVAHGGEAVTGDILSYATVLGVSNGFSDRQAVGISGNVYHPASGWGAHFDTSGLWREENGGFFAGGVSYAVTPTLRPKVMFGTSTTNFGILPEFFGYGSVTINASPFNVTPALIYRQYRNGTKQTTPQIDVAHYGQPFSDNSYLVAQALVGISFVSPGSNTGYDVGAGLTYVVPKLGTVALWGLGGRMAYDAALCVTECSVRNDFIGVRPKVSAYINDKAEFFVLGEYVRTDFYNIAGATVGLRTAF